MGSWLDDYIHLIVASALPVVFVRPRQIPGLGVRRDRLPMLLPPRMLKIDDARHVEP